MLYGTDEIPDPPTLKIADTPQSDKQMIAEAMKDIGDSFQLRGEAVLARAQEEPERPEGWPTLSQAALYGPAGRIVGAILPQTEADTAALLLNLLAAFGNLAGRNCCFEADGFEHYPILNFVTVGETCQGVKGTAVRRVQPVLRLLDPVWTRDRIQSGLSSGEGLIAALTGEDKRLFIIEEEFSKVFAVMKREGNTLSSTVRQSWDTGNLRTITKKDPLHVEETHITITGHITPRELQRRLDETEVANGFANRFLWIVSRRSKYLPFGGKPSLGAVSEMADSLRDAMNFAKQPRQLRRNAEADALWVSRYRKLADGENGLVGEVLARARPQVMRLAMIYALMDGFELITLDHLNAAFAVWEYARGSAVVLFGDALGDPIADRILRALRAEQGMDRTQIRDLFSRHAKADSIDLALALLKEKGLVAMQKLDTEGRSIEFWTATKAT